MLVVAALLVAGCSSDDRGSDAEAFTAAVPPDAVAIDSPIGELGVVYEGAFVYPTDRSQCEQITEAFGPAGGVAELIDEPVPGRWADWTPQNRCRRADLP